jgi:hypothetical protein
MPRALCVILRSMDQEDEILSLLPIKHGRKLACGTQVGQGIVVVVRF